MAPPDRPLKITAAREAPVVRRTPRQASVMCPQQMRRWLMDRQSSRLWWSEPVCASPARPGPAWRLEDTRLPVPAWVRPSGVSRYACRGRPSRSAGPEGARQPSGGSGGLLVTGRRGVVVLSREGFGDALERLLLGVDTQEDRDHARRQHEGRPDVVAGGEPGDVLAGGRLLDEATEVQRSGDTTGSGADRVEEGDAQRPRLHREHLTGGEVGRAGTRRGEEEDDHARRREGDGGKGVEVEAGDGEEDAGHDVGGGDHATRPTESNSGDRTMAPRKLLAANAAMYQPTDSTPKKVLRASPKVKKNAL